MNQSAEMQPYHQRCNFLQQLKELAFRCSMFCGGRRCKYESSSNWKKADIAIDGVYSHWITEDLMAMARPNTDNMEKYKTVDQFKEMGIKSVINLQTPGKFWDHFKSILGQQDLKT